MRLIRSLALCALATIAAAPAVAQDRVVDWTGFYAGITGGTGSAATRYFYEPFDASVPLSASSYLIGLDGGYNAQFNNIVVGIEVDALKTGFSDEAIDTGSAPCFTPGEGCTFGLTSMGSVRGRVGVAIGSVLPYATAGFALANVNGSADTGACADISCDYNNTVAGYALGLGVEWSASEWLSVKAEYLHTSVAGGNFDGAGGNPTSGRVTVNALRVGANYHF